MCVVCWYTGISPPAPPHPHPPQAKDHRLDVDVVLEAPVVCVPLSVPNQALVINMGVLKLKNKCERKSVTYQKGKGEVSEFDSVFEIFDIALDDFSIMRY